MALQLIQNLSSANPSNAIRQLRLATKTEDYDIRNEYINNGVFTALLPLLSSNNAQILGDAAMSCSFLLYQNPDAIRTAVNANILNALIPLLSSNVFDAKRGASNALNDLTNEQQTITSVVDLHAIDPLIKILEQHNEENLTEGAVMNIMNILLEGGNLQRNTEKNTFKTKFDAVNAGSRFLALFNNAAKGPLIRKIISFCLCLLYSSTKLPAEYLPLVNHVKTFIGSTQFSDSHYACFSLSNLIENSSNKLVVVDAAFVKSVCNNLRARFTYIVSNNCLLLRNICAPGLNVELKTLLKGCGVEAALQPLRNHPEENLRRDVNIVFYYFR